MLPSFSNAACTEVETNIYISLMKIATLYLLYFSKSVQQKYPNSSPHTFIATVVLHLAYWNQIFKFASMECEKLSILEYQLRFSQFY